MIKALGFPIELLASAQLIRSFPQGPGREMARLKSFLYAFQSILCGLIRITVDGNRVADRPASCADFRDPWLLF
jgi:hypothetical protein